ncbi:tetratricopeptide repeat protein 27 homolog [Schistocerca gregaria]|uniref:tetratricopeptide repeat protein 27 homolog n=1 Tax=Schistocerca gregaria TaxID=7010 RepID=UPI00211F397D|nr:tetratricopeptide repeat protein 27 homolog [Schistocerca gregaria]
MKIIKCEAYSPLEKAVLLFDDSFFGAESSCSSVLKASSPLLWRRAKEICHGNFLSSVFIPGSPESRIFEELRAIGAVSSFGKVAVQTLEKLIGGFLLENRNVESHLSILLAGVAALMVFVQSNWTGPPIDCDRKTENIIPFVTREQILDELEFNGETVYKKTVFPHYLVMAKAVLIANISNIDFCESRFWWSARCALKIQEILTGPSDKLRALQVFGYSKSASIYGDSPEIFLEQAAMCHQYQDFRPAVEYALKAMQSTGLQCNLSGVMGRRTKYQTFDTPQLVLLAKSLNGAAHKPDRDRPLDSESALVAPLFADVLSESSEDIRLKALSVSEETCSELIRGELSTIDQCIIMCLCLGIKSESPPHGLTWEQMQAYVDRVVMHPKNWLVHSTALLFKARLEVKNKKYMDRAALQMQVLVDQFRDGDAAKDYPAAVRCRYLFQLCFPPLFQLKKEIAAVYLNLGVIKSAKQLFEELEMWSEVIECMQYCNEDEKARELISRLIEAEGETPELLCFLGDVESVLKDKVALYCRCWEVSNNRYTRAKRELGRLCMNQRDYEGAITHFQVALKINPQHADCWFRMGCCALQIANWNLAHQAFSWVTSLRPDDGEAWSNLAASCFKSGKLDAAHSAFKEALKHHPENWRIWDNYATTSVKLGLVQESIYAINRLLDLNQKVDADLLSSLVDHAIEAHLDDSNESRVVQTKLRTVLGRITAKTSNADLWSIYARYYQSLGNAEKVVEFRQKQCRSLQTFGWEKSLEKAERVVEGFRLLVEALEQGGDKNSAYGAKLQVRSMLKKLKENFEFSETYKALEQASHKLDAVYQVLQAAS